MNEVSWRDAFGLNRDSGGNDFFGTIFFAQERDVIYAVKQRDDRADSGWIGHRCERGVELRGLNCEP